MEVNLYTWKFLRSVGWSELAGFVCDGLKWCKGAEMLSAEMEFSIAAITTSALFLLCCNIYFAIIKDIVLYYERNFYYPCTRSTKHKI